MRMPRGQRFWLDGFGLLLAAAFLALSSAMESPGRALIVGVATSFVFASLLDLLLAAQAQLAHRERVRFFGTELVRRETTLVYPDFVMHDDVRQALNAHNQQMLFQRPPLASRT